MGRVVSVEQPAADFRTHTVELPGDMAGGLQTGASVAHNGCCLTVTETDGRTARFDLMAETLDKTNLGRLKTAEGSLSLAVIKHSAAAAPLTDADGNPLQQQQLFFDTAEAE